MNSVPPWLRSPTVIGMATAGVVLTMVVYGTLRQWERHAQEEAAAGMVREKVGTLHIALLRSMEVLHSMAALHAADEHEQISRHQFGKFVDAALRRQPELLALSWNPVVPAESRAQTEREAQADGNPAFAFRELNSAGELVPAGLRPEYVPVRFIEPLNRNLAALGYDLNSDPGRRESVEKARDSGEPVATAPLRLAQEKAAQSGVLVVLPVYRHPQPTTVEARRLFIAGYAVAVFRASDLFSRAFQSLADQGIDVWLRDETPGSASPALLQGSVNGTPPPSLWSAPPVRLPIAGRTLAVHYIASSRFLSKPARHQSTLILLGGLVLTGLGTACLRTTRRRAIEVAAANAALHEEVRVRQQAEARAADASRAKSDFLASMSHEIRTPLNAMLGYAQILQRDASLSPDQRDCVGGINVSGRHLLGLINEILDLSKIEAGRMDRNDVDFDLPALACGLETTFKPLCAQQRIGFRVLVDTTGRAGSRVRGDEGKIRQILINLLGNAIKFTTSGEVVLQCRPEGRTHWRFDVTDTGQGIPSEEQADIFSPFHQGSGNRQRGAAGDPGNGSGTGLGLTIAQRQVDLLGGTLRLESERGRGSRFHFSIPLPEAPLADLSPRRQPAFLSPGSVVRALVVDDCWENRDVLTRLLAAVGCEVVGAETPGEALARVVEFRPTIAFVDWLMPSASGRELIDQLLDESVPTHPKIIAHSASPLQRHRDEAHAAGCVDFLTKPFRSEQLYECLSQHLGVTFDYVDAPMELASSGGLPAGFQISLPEDLQARLVVAAELHSTTALKGCLAQLRLHGLAGVQLADQIRHLMRSYDMDGIQRLLAGSVAPAARGPATVPVYGSDSN